MAHVAGAPPDVMRGISAVYSEIIAANKNLRNEFFRRLLRPLDAAATFQDSPADFVDLQ